jgi:hypothetical protein
MPYIEDGFIEEGYFGPEGWIAISNKVMRVERYPDPTVERENTTTPVERADTTMPVIRTPRQS